MATATKRLLALMLIMIAMFSFPSSERSHEPQLTLYPQRVVAAPLSAPVLTVTLPAVLNAGLIQQIQGGTQYYTATHTLNPGSLPFGSYTGASGYTTYARSLVQFDLAGLPTGATIQTATLELRTNDWPPNVAASGAIGAYRVTASWNEAVTWTTQPASDPAPLATATLQTGQAGPYRWDITGLAQGWQSNPSTNHGLLLGSAPALTSVIGWAGASTVRGNATGPVLVLQYSLPPAATPTATSTPTATVTPLATSTPGSPTPASSPTVAPTASAVVPTPVATPRATPTPTAAPRPTSGPASGDDASPPEVTVSPTELDSSRGAPLRCTITVTGTGSRAITDVRLELALPQGVSLLDARFAPEQSGWVSLNENGQVEMVLGPEGRIEPGQVIAVDMLLGSIATQTDVDIRGSVSYAWSTGRVTLPLPFFHIVARVPEQEPTIATTPATLDEQQHSHIPSRLPLTGAGIQSADLPNCFFGVALIFLYVGFVLKTRSCIR